jgi:hypothetical protein
MREQQLTAAAGMRLAVENADEVRRWYNHGLQKETLLSLGASKLSTSLRNGARRSASLVLAASIVSSSLTVLYAQALPIADSAERIARETGRRAASERVAQASPDERRGASWAEKTAFAWLLVGGIILITTSPGEKNADGTWTTDGKAEMFAGIGSVAISMALLRDILKK